MLFRNEQCLHLPCLFISFQQTLHKASMPSPSEVISPHDASTFHGVEAGILANVIEGIFTGNHLA